MGRTNRHHDHKLSSFQSHPVPNPNTKLRLIHTDSESPRRRPTHKSHTVTTNSTTTTTTTTKCSRRSPTTNGNKTLTPPKSNLLTRKLQLQTDPLLDPSQLTPKSVFCVMCQKSIKLDARNEYYPGLWRKHRDAFHRGDRVGVVKAEAEAARVGVGVGVGVEARVGVGVGSVTKVNPESDSDSEVPVIDEHEAAMILTAMLKKFASGVQ